MSQHIDCTNKLFKEILDDRDRFHDTVQKLQVSSAEQISVLVSDILWSQEYDFCLEFQTDQTLCALMKHLCSVPRHAPDSQFSACANDLLDRMKRHFNGEKVSTGAPSHDPKKNRLEASRIQASRARSNVANHLKVSQVREVSQMAEVPNPFSRQKNEMIIEEKKVDLEMSLMQILAKKMFDSDPERLNAKQISITVNYLADKVNLDYSYRQFKLKNILQDHIKKYLTKDGVEIITPSKEMSILEDQTFLCSEDAGNYFFDPFMDAIEIRIERTDKKPFSKKTFVQGNPKINFKSERSLTRKNENFTLKGKDRVQKLVQALCIEKNGSERDFDEVTDVFKKKGGAYTVEQLYTFDKQELKNLGVKTAWAHEAHAKIQKAKGLSEKVSKEQKQIPPKKRECIKKGNSHKILRYLVYKVHGMKSLEKIPFLSYEIMKEALDIVRKQIINTQLLDTLENNYFFQFSSDTGAIKSISKGMILYGPPGTGKTQLTERLPHLMGFHLIDQGKSAADFNTTYVGQTKRMLEDLVSRARATPYLLCSLGIDQVDGLVPDRKDKKEQKGSSEGISILLSLVGGNKDVPNLVFMTSTNHLKKIDEAMLRRFSGQYQVGRLTPDGREQIILQNLPRLKDQNQELFDNILKMTSNYTGAALIKLVENIVLLAEIKAKKGDRSPMSLFQVTGLASEVCNQFKIKLGMYSLPQIYAEQAHKQNACSPVFLKKISNQFLLISSPDRKRPNFFKIYFATKYRKYVEDGNRMVEKDFYQVNEQSFKVAKTIPNMELQTIQKWISQSSEQFAVEIQRKKEGQSNTSFLEVLGRKWAHRNKPAILLIEETGDGVILSRINFFKEKKKNLYVFYYIGRNSPNQYLDKLGWTREEENKKPFTGRIFIELNEDAKMDFQLKTKRVDESTLYEKPFLRTDQARRVNDVVPELINFFTTRKVSSIFLLDYNALMDNQAFDDQKQLEIVKEKIEEAINYDSVAIIIEADSLINVSKNLSESSMGPSQSYSITNHNMYQFIQNIINTFASVSYDEQTGKRKEKWISIVARNNFLIKSLKKSMVWPLTTEEEEEQEKQEKMNKKRKCIHCGTEYSERENQDERKCMRHPGEIINIKAGQFERVLTVSEARAVETLEKNRSQKKTSDMYMYACCSKGLNEQGECAYRHMANENEVDEQKIEMRQRQNEWLKILNLVKRKS